MFELEKKMLELIDEIKSEIPEEETKLIVHFISYGEWDLSLEYLCASIFENKIPISQRYFDKIESTGKKMDMPSKSWEGIRSLVRKK